MQRFATQSKLPSFHWNTLFPYKTVYFWTTLQKRLYKNADGNSKFISFSKLTFWKQPIIAEDEIKVSIVLANKYKVLKVKAKNLIIPIF